MKLIAVLATILFVCFSELVFGEPQMIRSDVSQATVFFQGAEVSRKATVNLSKGINELVFSGLPADTDPLGIRLQATGQITIHSVNFRRNALARPELSQETQMLEDSIAFYENRINNNKARIEVLEQEEALLAANRSIGGTAQGVEVAELRLAADFLRQRLTENKTSRINLHRDVQRDENRKERLRMQLLRNLGRLHTEVGELVAIIEAPNPVRSAMEITYFTANAGWTPNYDIRVEGTDKQINLLLKARVFQGTGEDWNNIRLAFSTGNPLQNNQLPELPRWFLDFDPEITVVQAARQEGTVVRIKGYNRLDPRETHMVVDETIVAETAESLVHATQGLTARKFQINAPFSLGSGAEPGMVELEKNNLSAIYEYVTKPKAGEGVFLVANIPQWQQFAFMPGEANIFLDGTFLGKTQINPATTQDTLRISLGRDPNIVVSRTRDVAFTQQRLIGGRITENVGWEISVRNNNNFPIILNIQDQIPVSMQGEIEVRPRELSGATLDAETGFVSWKLSIPPAGTQNLKFQYSVQYPRGRSVTLE